MYLSSRKRCLKTKWVLKLFIVVFLVVSFVVKSVVNNVYDVLIIEVCKGNIQLVLLWFVLKLVFSNN